MTTRREWLATFTAPAAVAAFAAASGVARAEPAKPGRIEGPPPDLGARVYNVRDFGAKGDGKALDTAALQAAVDACAADGGGVVLAPAGVFQIGTVELKSNVTLRLAAGATLLGSGDGRQYHAVDAIPLTGDSTLIDGNWALLFAVGARNVSVEGPGAIDGQGHLFHSPVRGATPPSGIGGPKRPYHLLFHRCENVRVRDIDLLDCAFHSVRIIQSRRIHLDGIYIHNRVNSNNDGFHFISAEYVTLSNSVVLAQDDACAMFGSCKFITVTNCVFSTRWSVFRFGGGHAENIAVSNCVLRQVYGCPIKLQGNPGSRYENFSFSNLVLDDVTGPIHIGVGPRPARRVDPAAPPRAPAGIDPANGLPLTDAPPVLRNFSFSNIHGTVTTTARELPEAKVASTPFPGELHSAIVLNCVGDAVMENISLDNVHLTFGGGGTMEEAARRDLPRIAGEYFMLGSIPAYGLYARGVRGLSLQNVRFQFSTPDQRPAVIFDRVTDAAINGLSVQADPGAESALRFIDSQDVLVSAARVLTPTPAFLQVEGAESASIKVDGGDIARAATPVVLRNGSRRAAVRLRG
ncbi:glycosyl hydrolase family 28 protein [Caulobacter sp. 1776]|uniref:glycoside hydrolase family 28 protein n=1 Tax=Caulobacter sp. 1776 TaxID=3156420 RepID=UPI00339181B0